MQTRAATFVAVLAIVPLGPSPAAAEDQHPNPNALINQWLEGNLQENIDAALSSAKQHAGKGEKDAAIAEYRKVLSLVPAHPDAVAGLKALGLSDASISSPTPTLGPAGSSSSRAGQNPSPPPASGGSGGGGMFPNGIY